SQRRTADASGWRPGDYCRAYHCRPGLLLLLPSHPGTEYPGLCCDHSIADWRADGTTIDGALASGPGRRGTWSIPGERSTKASTSEEERRPESANCGQQARKRYGFTKSINRSRKPPSEARDRGQGCADDYPVLRAERLPHPCCACLPRTHYWIEIALRCYDKQWRANDRRTQQPA